MWAIQEVVVLMQGYLMSMMCHVGPIGYDDASVYWLGVFCRAGAAGKGKERTVPYEVVAGS